MFSNRGFRNEHGRFITKEEHEKRVAEKAKRVWQAPLSKDSWFGVGVGDASTYYSKVSVVASWHGVTLAFDRKDGSDHLCIYLEPVDAREIGKELVKKAAVVNSIHVMARLSGRYDETLDYKIERRPI